MTLSEQEQGGPKLEHAVLGFDAKPQESVAQPGPTSEDLGDPEGAQKRAAERRRQEAMLEARLREPHEGGTIFERPGTGTTPYSHRLHHQVKFTLIIIAVD